jgi:hypothetical protein
MKPDEPSLLHWTAEDWWKYFNENKDMYHHLDMLLKRYDFIKTAARTNEHYPLVDAILSSLAKQITSTLAKIQTENVFNNE